MNLVSKLVPTIHSPAQPLHTLDCGWVDSVAWSPDGKTLATTGAGYDVLLWRTDNFSKVGAIDNGGNISRSVAFSNDGKLIAVGCSLPPQVRLYDAKALKLKAALNDPKMEVWALAFSPDSSLLAGGDHRTPLTVWSVPKRGLIVQPEMPEEGPWVSSLAFSPDGRILVAANFRVLIFLSTATWKPLKMITDDPRVYQSVAYSADGSLLAVGSGNGKNVPAFVQVFTTRDWRERARIPMNSFVNGVAFSPSGKHLAVVCGDSSVTLWEPRSGKLLQRYAGHARRVTSVAFSPTAPMFATGSIDETTKIWAYPK